MAEVGAGDHRESWRRAYRTVRKDPFRATSTTNRRRLRALGADGLDPSGCWLDLGAGDGNLAAALAELGVRDLVAVEPQMELLSQAAGTAARVVGSACDLPLCDGAVDVVVAMDVLHHLEPDRLHDSLSELRRVMRSGGHLLVCEPAATATRAVLTSALMSPLGEVSGFTRHKRQMVTDEQETLGPWLEVQGRFADVAAAHGFLPELCRVRSLHAYYRFAHGRCAGS